MSEKKETKVENKGDSLERLASDEKLEITIKKGTNEVTIRNPREFIDRVVRLRTNVEDEIEKQIREQEDEENASPLTPEEFEKALREVDSLGFTFTPEIFPSVIAKAGNSVPVDIDKLEKLEDKYPRLPLEAGLVVYNTLTSQKIELELIGGFESFKKKSEVVKNIIITNDFRDQFFFRMALKVPYFESIDWEVVLKTYERGVEGVVAVPYALLMLTFHDTNAKGEKSDAHQNVTVAVNRYLIDKLLAALTRVRNSLEESEKIRDRFNDTKSLTE